MTAVLFQRGQAQQGYKKARRGRFLQGVFHLSELRPSHPVDEVTNKLIYLQN